MKGVQGPRRVGLARTLSKLGYCSRSQGFELVRAGRVKVNGRVDRNPERPVRWPQDRIEVEGQNLGTTEKVYLMLNKPRGVVTTTSDEKGRETVYDLLSDDLPWVAPVGRLDKASEGLLLLTNDSEWGARVLAPETHLSKTYHVQVARVADSSLVSQITAGVRTDDGDFLRANSAQVVRSGGKNSWLEIVLDEGKNRHIRRMLAQFGIEVLRLVRVAVGPLTLGGLRKGASRPLTGPEKKAVDLAMREEKKKRRP